MQLGQDDYKPREFTIRVLAGMRIKVPAPRDATGDEISSVVSTYL